VQFTVRLPRFVATAFAIVVVVVAVTAVLPATAASDTSIVVCIDPATKNLTIDPACAGSTLTWNQQGVAGTNGATGATGPTGPAGPQGPTMHLNKSKPALAARIEAALEIQDSTISNVNHDLHASLATTSKLAPSTDPTVLTLQTAVNVQGSAIARLVNVLRALTKAQRQLLQGLE
jgi:hypothetical protein